MTQLTLNLTFARVSNLILENFTHHKSAASYCTLFLIQHTICVVFCTKKQYTLRFFQLAFIPQVIFIFAYLHDLCSDWMV